VEPEGEARGQRHKVTFTFTISSHLGLKGLKATDAPRMCANAML